MTDRAIAACDGACKGNPGPAAWAWVLVEDVDSGSGRWAAGPLGDATNNVAELTALEQLLSAAPATVPLEVRMDSQYAMNAVTKWLPGWKRRGWKTASGGPVANRELKYWSGRSTPVFKLSGTSRFGMPPKNSNAATCAAFHDAWSIEITGRTNMCREEASTMMSAQIRCRLPVCGSVHIPSDP